MPNPWFTPPAAIVDGTLADAIDINELRTAIITAFDALALGTSAQYTKQAKGNLGANPSFDLSVANYFTATVDQIIASVSITGEQAGSTVAQGFIVELTNGGAFAITWGAGIKWQGALAPTLTTAGKDFLAFLTSDGGVTWHGFVTSLDSR